MLKIKAAELCLNSTQRLRMGSQGPKAKTRTKHIMAVKLFLVKFWVYLFPLHTAVCFITNSSLCCPWGKWCDFTR